MATGNTFKKRMTLKELLTLSNRITVFCQYPGIPTYIVYKLLQFQDMFMKDVTRYSNLNQQILERLSPGKEIRKYTDNGERNPLYDTWYSEIVKVQEEQKEVTFERLPLSTVMKVDCQGSLPNELFYEDKASKVIFDKMLSDNIPASDPAPKS